MSDTCLARATKCLTPWAAVGVTHLAGCGGHVSDTYVHNPPAAVIVIVGGMMILDFSDIM